MSAYMCKNTGGLSTYYLGTLNVLIHKNKLRGVGSNQEKDHKNPIRFYKLFLFFLAMPMICGNSWARD